MKIRNLVQERRRYDKPMMIIIIVLLIVGFLVFFSAALSILPKNPALFYRMLASQIVLGIIGGGVLAYLGYRLEYNIFRLYSLPIFIGAIALTAAVFIPGLGMSHGGATRWINLGFLSFQPAEILKTAFVIYFAAWYSWAHSKISDMKYGILPFGVMIVVTGIIMLLQPDTDTFLIMITAGLGMYFVSGARMKDFGIIALIGIVGAFVLVLSRPYLMDRFKTFINPESDPHGSSYQVRQSLIAVGSGGILGRGYGQSIQKFSYLPEATGDSVFAVVGEELGFIGSFTIIVLYALFALRGLYIARRSPNMFGRLLVTGLTITVVAQSFLNIASNTGLFPLSGLPLIFMSQGGTSLAIALLNCGLILHVSQFTNDKAVRR